MERILTTTVLLVAIWVSSATAQVLRYGGTPGTTRTYVREQSDHVVQTVNGQQTATNIQSYWRLRTTVTAEVPETLTIGIVHDSLSITGTAPLGDLGTGVLRERPIELVMTRRGVVRALRIPEDLPPATARLDLESTYQSFFPRLPEEAAIEGFVWSDTTRVVTHQNGLDLQVVRVNRYTSKGWANLEQGRVVRVEYEAELRIEGSGEQQEAGIVLSGSGRSIGAFLFDPDAGAYGGGREAAEMRMVALVTTQGESLVIPIVQNRTETITLESSAPL